MTLESARRGREEEQRLGPERTLLEAVRVLHNKGYGRLRALPYLAPSGLGWRLELSKLLDPVHGVEPRFRYTSASGWELFASSEVTYATTKTQPFDEVTPSFVAHAMTVELELDDLRGGLSAYTYWFSALLDHAGTNYVPYHFGDSGIDYMKARYIPLVDPHDASVPEVCFPLAPIF
ncbi:hypothetical protein [Zhihengliuella flava]|uniref:Uncharacterized protein n=1 Tax=Zhihengliuella flava TaxID=1285193 RepID=A0A931D884_9MICC|nr:hypothetical protein [Zhihengliuella flava]MBG6083818.1 hypothetical protein [Zhihengliuella flava]